MTAGGQTIEVGQWQILTDDTEVQIGPAIRLRIQPGGGNSLAAAAVRLAMAEVLAADHGGCLPVVFDDAFAYSDPERVNQLQRMLDLAATRGLQVIILTCNPVDYAALGAKPVVLRPERHGPAVGSNPVPELATEVLDATSPDLEVDRPAGAEGVIVTPELCESLLRALSALGGSKGNQALRQELGWDDPTYSAVRQPVEIFRKIAQNSIA